jgi:hypothetical protein
VKRITPCSVLLIGLVVLMACNETEPTVSQSRPIPMGRGTLATMPCGASFQMISNDSDSLMAQYGIPSSVDTVDICESWTGSDYTYQATLVGSSDNVALFPDTIPVVTYEAGYITGYDAADNVSSDASSVGGTSFDFVKADAATKQASFDYPYYAISSPDPTPSSCVQPPCPVMERTAGQSPNMDAQASQGSDHHGLRRRGFRALADSAVELTRGPGGLRRFQSSRGDRKYIRSIDPKTELLAAEEEWSARDTARIVHTWRKVPNGYVRKHSEIESVSQVNGHWVHEHSQLDFKKVHIHDKTFDFDDDGQ